MTNFGIFHSLLSLWHVENEHIEIVTVLISFHNSLSGCKQEFLRAADMRFGNIDMPSYVHRTVVVHSYLRKL